ncbi:TraM recognition domain-containing protein [Pseudobacteriovorax antillogorgiicola]|nr:TraM recognition domain-containing protein [Pseudobacteriovorax antillogorgiicola]
MILHQLILRGVVTVVMAPKHDSFLSGVLAIAARIRGIHLHHVRIRHTMLPNPFASCSGEDIYEILVDGLKQSDTGRESDFYRIAGRKVARILSNYWADKNPSFRDLESSIENLIDSDLAKKAQGFIERISELAHYFPPHHISNIDIKDVISKGDSIIITGDTMNTTIQTLHKIYAIRTVQIISQREFDNDHKQVTMFCDELKFLICPTLVRSFGVVLDRRLSYIAAFQTIGDLSDSTDLDPITIERSILDNSTIKLVYQQSDFSTAQWASNLSGKSIVNARSMHTQATTQGHFLPTSSTSYSEVGSNLFSTNIFQSLPKGCAVLFNGNKVAQLAYVCPIPIDKEKDKALTVMLPDNKLDDEMDLDIGRALL